jgi:hypothetical protein
MQCNVVWEVVTPCHLGGNEKGKVYVVGVDSLLPRPSQKKFLTHDQKLSTSIDVKPRCKLVKETASTTTVQEASRQVSCHRASKQPQDEEGKAPSTYPGFIGPPSLPLHSACVGPEPPWVWQS